MRTIMVFGVFFYYYYFGANGDFSEIFHLLQPWLTPVTTPSLEDLQTIPALSQPGQSLTFPSLLSKQARVFFGEGVRVLGRDWEGKRKLSVYSRVDPATAKSAVCTISTCWGWGGAGLRGALAQSTIGRQIV
jgi:hypothetical protein